MRLLTFTAAAFMVLAPGYSLNASTHSNTHAARKMGLPYDHHEATCNVAAALGTLAEELRDDPTARGHIIFYLGYNNPGGGYFRKQSPHGLIYRHPLGIRDYLVTQEEIDPDRFVITYGGKREFFQGDVWIVPEGATPPRPTPAPASEVLEVQEPFLFDEYLHDPYREMQLYLDPDVRLSGFAQELSNNTNTTGYIIGYAKTPAGKRMAEGEKKFAVELHGAEASRIITMDGGYRDSRMIEMWIVPEGAAAPNPTPGLRKTKN